VSKRLIFLLTLLLLFLFFIVLLLYIIFFLPKQKEEVSVSGIRTILTSKVYGARLSISNEKVIDRVFQERKIYDLNISNLEISLVQRPIDGVGNMDYTNEDGLVNYASSNYEIKEGKLSIDVYIINNDDGLGNEMIRDKILNQLILRQIYIATNEVARGFSRQLILPEVDREIETIISDNSKMPFSLIVK